MHIKYDVSIVEIIVVFVTRRGYVGIIIIIVVIVVFKKIKIKSLYSL